jgi:nanoRNase/pAp phosphatase (c-di-AMP/oligoRNAs hydrolase)
MRSESIERENPVTQENLELLRRTSGTGPVLILTHDYPDPDALASGMALSALISKAWDIPSKLVYSGVVARAENRAMLHLLTPSWEFREQVQDFDAYSAIALVDTQPGAGNNSYPTERNANIVIDHHNPIRDHSHLVPYTDIRPDVGATSTLLFQYFQAADITPDQNLATAMFYGLHTDTQGLARGASTADEMVYFDLLGLLDRKMLVQVEQAGLSRLYFQAFCGGLQAARVYGKVIISDLGSIHRPDLSGEMADVLIRLDSARAALCYGTHSHVLYLSLRTKSLDKDAGTIAQALVAGFGKAGGHGSMAGGQVPLADLDLHSLIKTVDERMLTILDETSPGIPLLDS